MFKMLRLIFILYLLVFVTVFAASNKDQSLYCQSYGARTSATLDSIIDDVGTEPSRLVVEKVWNVTSNLTFPTNISLYFYPGGSFNTYSNYTVTINGSFEGEDTLNPIFTGLGTVTGSGTCLYWYDAWGSTSTCPIYANAELPTTNGLPDRIEAVYPDFPTSTDGFLVITTNSVTNTIDTGDTYAEIKAQAQAIQAVAAGEVATFRFTDGTYTFTNSLDFYDDILGPGEVHVIGNTNDASLCVLNFTYTTNAGDGFAGGFVISGNTSLEKIHGFTINGSANVQGAAGIFTAGVRVDEGSSLRIYGDVVVSNWFIGFLANKNSSLTMWPTNSIKAIDCDKGFFSSKNSTLFCRGTIAEGCTAEADSVGYYGQDAGYMYAYQALATNCNYSFRLMRGSWMDARSTTSGSHVTDDYDPNINTVGNQNSYIYK